MPTVTTSAYQARVVANQSEYNGCDSASWELLKDLIPLGRWMISLIPKVSRIATLGSAAIDSLHGSILAYSVKIESLSPNRQKTHLGHGQASSYPLAGKPLTFSLKISMQDDLADVLVKCGWIAGTRFPVQGAIPNVEVDWPYSDFVSMGTFTCPADGCQKTNSQGIATLTFTPRQELLPGVGMDKSHGPYHIWPTVKLQKAFNNYPGRISDLLKLNSQIPSFYFDVGMHDSGYKIDSGWLIWSEKIDPSDHGGNGTSNYRERWVIETCNQDPYHNDWTATIQFDRAAIPDNPAYVLPLSAKTTRTLQFSEEAPTTFVDHAVGVDPYEVNLMEERIYFGMQVTVSMIDSDPATASITLTPVGGGYDYTVGSRSATVRIMPNENCR